MIGGGEVYALALPLATHLHLTLVDTVVEGADAFFPRFDARHWRETARDPPSGGCGAPVRVRFRRLRARLTRSGGRPPSWRRGPWLPCGLLPCRGGRCLGAGAGTSRPGTCTSCKSSLSSRSAVSLPPQTAPVSMACTPWPMNRPSVRPVAADDLQVARRWPGTSNHGYSPGGWRARRALVLERDAPARAAIAHAGEDVDDGAVAVAARAAAATSPGRRRTCSSAACGSRRRAGGFSTSRACFSASWVVHFGASPACTIIQPSLRSTWASLLPAQPGQQLRRDPRRTARRCRSGLTLRCSSGRALGRSPAATGRGCPAPPRSVRAANAPGAGFPATGRRG